MQKKSILSKKYINLEELKKFIIKTRKSNYTKFNINREFKAYSKRENVQSVNYDVIFGKCLLISFKCFNMTNILKIAGVDLTEDAPYEIAFKEMKWALDELENLIK